MSDDGMTEFQERIRDLAGSFHYPATPDVGDGVRARIEARAGGLRIAPALGWAAAAVLLAAIIAVSAAPAARASLSEMVRIGAVRLLFGPAVEEELGEAPGVAASEIDFAGESTLEAARQAFSHPIRLPTYPAQLGEPDRVFVQDEPATGVILVWLNGSDSVQLALFQLTQPVFKWQPTVIEQTRVNDAVALWTEGPYWVEIQGGAVERRRLIRGYVLIWERSGVTYRLETHLPLTEARRIAESLRPQY